MKIEAADISILVNRDQTTIEIRDKNASVTFARIVLTPEQLSAALSRCMYIDCEAHVFSLDRVGKKHENKSFVFEIKQGGRAERDKSDYLNETAIIALNESGLSDWVPDKYYGSQDSFFSKGGKDYARVTIRRWL